MEGNARPVSQKKPFKQRLFLSLIAVALIPVGLALAASWFALREALLGAGAAGPWSQVGTSGGTLLELLAPYAEADSVLQGAAETHRQALSESVRFSRLYELLTQRFLRLMPILLMSLGALIVVFSTAAARRLARALSRPIEDLVGWTDRIARGEPLPAERPGTDRGVEELSRLEEALRSMAEELERGRRRDIEAARLRSWSTMARRVAHELKNPLTPIRFAATRVARNSDPSLSEAGAVILEEVGRLDDMARSFSQLGRLPEGPPSEVDLLELLQSLARSHSGEKIQVRVSHLGTMATIEGHLTSLEAVFRNLLANALEAMEDAGKDGEIRLSLRDATGGKQIHPRNSQSDQALGHDQGVVVSIDDQGPGLPEELRRDLWVPEFTTKRRGTGLGLALVRQTVELHGGTVHAEDRPEGGARFEVWLPLRAGGNGSKTGG
jgi:nitrogen fixation/metabolism regulation signal transduction histidine kinase